ncbi:hypothetical protein CYMTET_47037 [Cymbomonas tetramitiformis]|uniref:Conserved oligomeric Golgi complex subunit 5 n=1 Tax=Cymbomonas tetramitiformis TaxID=36881 RepID=A0AAE0BX00_9CHLO|nr:hypothetical protein CYMTET_47037 [Cymbomonas tetramitiformis]
MDDHAIATESSAHGPEQLCPVLKQFQQDRHYSAFLNPNFEATAYSSTVLSQSTATASTQALEEGIHALEAELREEVVARHSELLSQVGSLRDTENTLGIVRSGVASLKETVARVRAEIAEPYRQIQTRTRQLAALNETVDLLRRVIRMLKLIAKLREQQNSKTPDLSKAAKIISDIDMLQLEGDLSGVDVLEAEAGWLAAVGKDVRSKAEAQLKQGMNTLSQAEVGSVLQVYYNLGELKPTVHMLVAKYVQQLGTHMADCLNPAKISAVSAAGGAAVGTPRGGAPQAGGAQRWQQALWQQLGSCMEAMHSAVVAIWHLQRVLAKKRDPITHVCFIDTLLVPGQPTLTEKLWNEVVEVLQNALVNSYNGGTAVKEALVLGYPRLAALLDSMFTRLLRDTEVKGISAAVKPEDLKQLEKAAEVYCNGYLNRSLTRMSESVTALFSGGRAAPTPSDANKLVGRFKEELDSVLPDARLAALVSQGLSTTMKLLGEKCEYQLATGPEARQVSGPCTSSQQKNLQLCALLQDVHHAFTGMLNRLPASAIQSLQSALTNLEGVVRECLTPLFKALGERFDSCLLKMHEENFSTSESSKAGTTNCSEYMEELLKVVAFFRAEFSQRIAPGGLGKGKGAVAAELMCAQAARLLEMFVRHAALVRPLSESGKLRLAKDMAELEIAVGQNLYPVEQLGAQYRSLRAFRPLLFLDTAQVPSSPLLHELPISVVMHHLYTRGPKELVSPHMRAGLSPAQYSLWLDQHTPEEVWKGVKGTLDSYAQIMKTVGKEIAPVHPIMLTLGSTIS